MPDRSPSWKTSSDVRVYIVGGLLFAVVMVLGLYIVKWQPSYHKGLLAAARHTIGPSIITGTATTPPGASWSAAIGYVKSYLAAVWQAWVLGILAGAAVQTLIPKDWVVRLLGRNNWTSTLVACLASTPSMM
jgi:hypothetical protein